MLVKVDLNWSKLLPYTETNLTYPALDKPGVYRIAALLDGKLRVVYVGKAKNVGEKLRNHRRFFEPNSFLKSMLEEKECFFCHCEVQDHVDRQNVEYTLFQHYHPACNIVEPKGQPIDINFE